MWAAPRGQFETPPLRKSTSFPPRKFASVPQPKPKTVLYLTPSVRLLGARRSLLSLVRHLDPERWRPIVCGQSHGDLESALQEEDIPFEIAKLGWWRKGKYFLWRPFAIASLAALIRRVDADLIHCNEIYPNPYAVRARAQASRALGRPIPIVTHMRLSVTPRMIRNYDLHAAEKIVVPSKTAGRDFDGWVDKEDKVDAIYNGVDLGEFRRLRSAAEARRQVGLPSDGIVIGAIGQLGPRKGGDIILDAMERIAERFPNAVLFFVGNPHRGQEEFSQSLIYRANKAPLAGHVHFFEFTRNILPFYEALDVNLLISRDEGFGRTIIEAAAMGVPSIGARVGGIPELIDDGNTGLLVEKENSEQLAEALTKLLEDPARSKTLGEAAYRHVAQNFSIQTHADAVMDLYDSLVRSAASEAV